MEKKVSEKEKFYQRAVRMVERLVEEGMLITAARNSAAVKFGISYPKMVRLTRHLSPKANR